MRRNTAVFIALAMFSALQARGADLQHDVGVSSGYFAASDVNMEDGWVTNFNWEVHTGTKLAFRFTLGTIGTDFVEEMICGESDCTDAFDNDGDGSINEMENLWKDIDFNIKWYTTMSLVVRGQREWFNPHVIVGLGAYKIDPVLAPGDNPEDSQVFHFGPHAGFGASLRAGDNLSFPFDIQMHWVIDKRLEDLGVTITAGARLRNPSSLFDEGYFEIGAGYLAGDGDKGIFQGIPVEVEIENGSAGNLRFGGFFTKHWGLEGQLWGSFTEFTGIFDLGSSSISSSDDVNVMGLDVSTVLRLNSSGKFNFLLLGGIGAISRADTEVEGVDFDLGIPGPDKEPVDIGSSLTLHLGAAAKIFLRENFYLRPDVRYLYVDGIDLDFDSGKKSQLDYSVATVSAGWAFDNK